MNEEFLLSMQVNPKQLDSFCKKIIARSRNTSNIHEALVVLEAFVSAFSSDSQGADNYKHIQEILKSHSSKTRDKLMQEKTQHVIKGLLTHERQLLADVYGSLSRNGFYQILTSACEQIDRSNISDIAQWVTVWANEAKLKAEKASGYPDALDFKKADIDIEHYQSMTDIAYFFNHTYK